MQRNNFISDKQYDFFSGRTTTLRLLNEWTEIIDKGDQIDEVYMDVMEAFGKVPHNKLKQQKQHTLKSGL